MPRAGHAARAITGVTLLVLCFLGLLSGFAHGAGAAVPAPQVNSSETTAVYDIEGRKKSIDTWRVSLESSGAIVTEAVALFRSNPETGSEGFVVWRTSSGCFARTGLGEVPFGWDKETVLDLTGGKPVPDETLQRLLAMEGDFDSLPRKSIRAADDGVYFIYLKRGGTEKKYRIQGAQMILRKPPHKMWERFLNATDGLLKEP